MKKIKKKQEETEIKYTPEPHFKTQVVEAAVDYGFKCILDDGSVVIFDNSNNKEEVMQWLFKNYSKDGKSIPFSYGFRKIENEN